MGKIIIRVPQEIEAEYDVEIEEDAVEIVAFLKKHAAKKQGAQKKLSGIWKTRYIGQSAEIVSRELRETLWRRF
jgi:hypothetical protein